MLFQLVLFITVKYRSLQNILYIYNVSDCDILGIQKDYTLLIEFHHHHRFPLHFLNQQLLHKRRSAGIEL